MHASRLSTLLLCSIVTVLASGPAVARAQSSDPERPSIRVGPVEFKPRLAFTNMGVDYNVFNEKTNPKRDFTFTAIPIPRSPCTRDVCVSRTTPGQSLCISASTRANKPQSKPWRPGRPGSQHPQAVCLLHLHPDERTGEFRDRRSCRAPAAGLCRRYAPEARLAHRDGVHRARVARRLG